MSDEAVPAVPFDGEEFDAKVYGAFIAAIDKGYFYSFSFVVTAEAFGRDGSACAAIVCPTCAAKGLIKALQQRTAAVYRIGEIQQANGHVLCFFACCRKVAKNFSLSFMYSSIPPRYREILPVSKGFFISRTFRLSGRGRLSRRQSERP